MKTRPFRRKTAKVSHSRWLAYATAGAATALGGGNSAEAAIHYSGPENVLMEGVRTVAHPLTGGASLNFYVNSTYYARGAFWITDAESASARVYQTSSRFHLLANIRRANLISLGPFSSVLIPNGRVAYIRSFYGRSYFGTHDKGFIGFKFNIGNGTQYGWVRLTVSVSFFGKVFRYVIRDYAWGDPGESIKAGQRSSNDLVPEEGSLGGLALGAAGLLAWRKAQSRVAR